MSAELIQIDRGGPIGRGTRRDRPTPNEISSLPLCSVFASARKSSRTYVVSATGRRFIPELFRKGNPRGCKGKAALC